MIPRFTRLFVVFVTIFQIFSSAQDFINTNCAPWSQWIQGGSCVMPNMLANVVRQRCPAAELPGWFFCGNNDVFAYINQPCGQCTVDFQCRTRPNAYACSPTLEVERIPCQYMINNQPCVLNSNTCMMAGYGTIYGRRRKRGNYLNETIKLFYDSSLYSRSTYPRPSLNCVRDTTAYGGGCQCCCYPYRPIGTQCIP